MSAFARELRGVLRRRALSQYRAAKEIGCTASYLSRLLSGERRPTRKGLRHLCEMLDLPQREADVLGWSAGFLPERYAELPPATIVSVIRGLERRIAVSEHRTW